MNPFYIHLPDSMKEDASCILGEEVETSDIFLHSLCSALWSTCVEENHQRSAVFRRRIQVPNG